MRCEVRVRKCIAEGGGAFDSSRGDLARGQPPKAFQGCNRSTYLGLRIVHRCLDLGNGGTKLVCYSISCGASEGLHGVVYPNLRTPFGLVHDILERSEDNPGRFRREQFENALRCRGSRDADNVALIHVEVKEDRQGRKKERCSGCTEDSRERLECDGSRFAFVT